MCSRCFVLTRQHIYFACMLGFHTCTRNLSFWGCSSHVWMHVRQSLYCPVYMEQLAGKLSASQESHASDIYGQRSPSSHGRDLWKGCLPIDVQAYMHKAVFMQPLTLKKHGDSCTFQGHWHRSGKQSFSLWPCSPVFFLQIFWKGLGYTTPCKVWGN